MGRLSEKVFLKYSLKIKSPILRVKRNIPSGFKAVNVLPKIVLQTWSIRCPQKKKDEHQCLTYPQQPVPRTDIWLAKDQR